jgi:hypothetical protein
MKSLHGSLLVLRQKQHLANDFGDGDTITYTASPVSTLFNFSSELEAKRFNKSSNKAI